MKTLVPGLTIYSCLLALAGSAVASPEMLKKYNCTACHAFDKKMVGPAYKDVAAKYRSDVGAAEKLAKKIRAGVSGVWGPIPMPSHPHVSEVDALVLANYVIGREVSTPPLAQAPRQADNAGVIPIPGNLPACSGNRFRWTDCFGTHTWDSGAKYVGEWRAGKFHGQGIYTYADGLTIREGLWDSDRFVRAQSLPDNFAGGISTPRLAQNSRQADNAVVMPIPGNLPACSGRFSRGWTNCIGEKVIDGEYRYKGEFLEGKRHGFGQLDVLNPKFNGDQYSGEWSNDKRNGQGTYTFSNGRRYVGEWRDGKYNGQGILTYADGRPPREGIWEDNKFVLTQPIPDHIAGRVSTSPVARAQVYGDATQSSLRPSKGAKEYSARHILVDRKSDAEAIISRLTAGEKFESFLRLSKGDPRNQGRLGWADAKTLGEPLARAIISLNKGQFTRTPVSTALGWHVILLDDVREGDSPVAQASRPVEAPRSATPLSLSASASQPSPDGVVTLSITTNNATASLKINGDEEGGRTDGRYSVRKFAQVGENKFEVVAVDRSGNTQRQTVSVVRQPADNVARFAALNPVSLKARPPRDAVAIIIGIQDYRRVSKADFANNDARRFYDYAIRGLGVPAENIKLLLDDKADDIEILGAFKNWLPLKTRKGLTDVYVFYSGHGYPSDDGASLYFLPHGVDRQFLDRSAIKQSDIVQALQAVVPKSVTLFLDACYSGQSRTGETLLAGARPIAIQPKASTFPSNFTVLSASAPEQIASSSPELKHGIFSYFLMKGMEGEADQNKDGVITVQEMQSYLSDSVGRKAMSLSRTQQPQVVGDQAKVLVGR